MPTRIDSLRKCCICLSQNCSESIDHSTYTIDDLNFLINKSKRNLTEIDGLKQAVKDTYNKVKVNFLKKIEKDEQIFQQWLSQFYFSHMGDRINQPLLCQLAQRNYSQLPTKSLKKLIKILSAKNHSSEEYLKDLPSSFNDAKIFIEKLDVDSITDKTMRLLGVEKIVKSVSTSSLLSLSSKQSMSLINPEEYQHYPEVYEWKNIKINHNSRTIELSNKNLKDQDLIRQIPNISSFKNIRQFEIRNNFITALSCKIIVNNLSFIQCLDIRGNRVGDTGVEYIAKGMPQLKSLLISQTGMTDRSGRFIAQRMQNLELFWAEHNEMTGEVILAIASKPKVKVMSVVGNQIDKKYSSILHGLFVRKGYIVL